MNESVGEPERKEKVGGGTYKQLKDVNISLVYSRSSSWKKAYVNLGKHIEITDN